MMAKELQDWFPEAQISDQPVEKGAILLPFRLLSSGFCWRKAGLSEREKQLISLLTQQEQARSLNPWYSYLVEGRDRHHKLLKRFSWFIVIFPISNRENPSFLAGYDADSISLTVRQCFR